MRAHTIDEDGINAILDMIGTHRVTIAMGRSTGGRTKRLTASLHQQFFVESEGVQRWHGTDWREAVEFYNTL